MSKHFRVPNRTIKKLDEAGVSASEVLRRAGLPLGLFEQQRVLVTTEEMFALWRGIGETSQDPAHGLKLGTEDKVERYDPIGLAALAAASFWRGRQTDRPLQGTHLPGRDPDGSKQWRVEHPVPLATCRRARARHSRRRLLRMDTLDCAQRHGKGSVASAPRTDAKAYKRSRT